jgi:hypothetical protein
MRFTILEPAQSSLHERPALADAHGLLRRVVL